MTKIAFIGFGEAGQAMAAGLAQEPGVTGLSAFDIRFLDHPDAPMLAARAAERNVTVHRSNATAVAGADLIISVVVGSQAAQAGKETGPHLARGQVFVDLNSISPDAKQRVSSALGRPESFVEGAVMARVPPEKHKVPILLAGRQAERAAALMTGVGMKVEAVGTEIGQACAVKMIRSVMVKGVEALLIEALTAAERAGVTERILDSISGTFPGFDWREAATYYIGRTQQHGARRVTEMNEAAATLESFGLDPVLSRGIAETIRVAHGKFKASGLPFDRGYAEMLAVLAADRPVSGEKAA